MCWSLWKQSGGHMTRRTLGQLNYTITNPLENTSPYSDPVLSGKWWSTDWLIWVSRLIWPHDLLQLNWPYEMKGPIIIRRALEGEERPLIACDCSNSKLNVEECNEILCKFLRRWTFVLIHSCVYMIEHTTHTHASHSWTSSLDDGREDRRPTEWRREAKKKSGLGSCNL